MSDRPEDESLDDAARHAKSGLAYDAGKGVQFDLEAAIADKLIARSDAGSAIASDLAASAGLALPTLADIAWSAKDVAAQDSLRQIEDLLLHPVSDLAEEGSRLIELLDRGASTLGERNILHRGMLFLRNRRYREAEEWWTLNQPDNPWVPFSLLLQLLLILTHKLAGDEARAVARLRQLQPRLGREAAAPDKGRHKATTALDRAFPPSAADSE